MRSRSAFALASLVLVVITGACGGDDAADGGGSGAGAAAVPNDGRSNGDESDVDCGGKTSPKCETGKTCRTHDDCASGACSYAKKCVAAPSCVGHFGGDTCGAGETGTEGAKHESCCTTVTNAKGLRVGKYLITAGRMRAFVERFDGRLQDWAATAKGWDPKLTPQLPSNIDEANFMLGPNMKRGCNITPDGQGGRTYFMPPEGEDKNDYSKDVLDEKALNCVPWVLAKALCAFDGGRLPTHDEARALVTNDGENDYPWQFEDDAPHRAERKGDPNPPKDSRLAHWFNYATPNPPADIRKGSDGAPLDRSFYIAPPGRFPHSANKIGVQDAAGNMLPWVDDEERAFIYTASWEQHEIETSRQTWPDDEYGEDEDNGYYAIGGRCVFP